MKVLLVCNTGWNLYNFRRPVARILKEQGYEPVLVSPRDEYVPRLIAEGFRWIELPMNRRSMNPFKEFAVFWKLLQIYRHEKPIAVHHFTIKCVLYGSIAARLSGVRRVINGITGLGHVFLGKSAILPWVTLAYRFALGGKNTRVIFQNLDDLNHFEKLGLTDHETAVLIKSSGVDLQRFSPASASSGGPQRGSNIPTVLFAGRLLREKGIYDFIDAAESLKARGVQVRFEVAGERDPGNPSTLSEVEIGAIANRGIVRFLGRVDQIEENIAASDLVVLPSYREGVPRILLEASAMEKAIVATDVPGCRDVVKDGENGLLVPVRNPRALADAIERLLENPELRREMGQEGRKRVIREFDDRAVAQQTWNVYQGLGIERQI
jgi:glycosyltransferase involved in cell wall biosynthesis